ncbi:MAG: hypothetical protein JSR82_13000 [Verrucomicrobia bacterium]|nr:hypothetical protein [Verrucomicrobiota bacterium]
MRTSLYLLLFLTFFAAGSGGAFDGQAPTSAVKRRLPKPAGIVLLAFDKDSRPARPRFFWDTMKARELDQRLTGALLHPGHEIFLQNPYLFIVAKDGTPLRGFIVSSCSPKYSEDGYKGIGLREFRVSGRRLDFRLGELLHGPFVAAETRRSYLQYFRAPWLKELLGVDDLGFGF